jgi:CheY-like chemotaxis protein
LNVVTPDQTSYVLVVDDEKPIRTILRRRLESWNYTVKEACSAAEALEIIVAAPPVIELLDINMPGRDGLWLAERIREQWSDIAIVIVSGGDDLSVVERSRHLGAVGYVRKPFDREVLRQALHRAAEKITAAG